MGREVILMSSIKFDINNLFAKKEVLISTEEIVEIVYFAIKNKIVRVETELMDVCADEDYIEIEDKILRLGFTETRENVLIRPSGYKVQ